MPRQLSKEDRAVLAALNATDNVIERRDQAMTDWNRRIADGTWWTWTMYEDTTPLRDLRAVNFVKLHIAQVRHLWHDHDLRFPRQVGAPALSVLHDHLHETGDEKP